MAQSYKDKIKESLRNKMKRDIEQKILKDKLVDNTELETVRVEEKTCRDDIMQILGEDKFLVKAVPLEQPGDHIKVNCQSCNVEILAHEPGVDRKWRDYERRNKICPDCREKIIGYGGLVDTKTKGNKRRPIK